MNYVGIEHGSWCETTFFNLRKFILIFYFEILFIRLLEFLLCAKYIGWHLKVLRFQIISDYRRDREKPVPPQIRLPDDTRFGQHDGFKQSTMYCHDMAPTAVDFDCLQSPHDNRDSICSPENEMSSRQMELLKENRTGSAKTMSKSNLKNSRRKMEKPRKRKRVPESGIDPKISKLSTVVSDKAGMVSQPVPPGNADQRQEETGANSKRFSEQKESSSGITNGLAARDNNAEALTRSSSPEDLSAVRPGSSSPAPGDRDSHSQPLPGTTSAIHDAWLSTVSGACSSSASDGYPDNHRIAETTASVTSSVHDLEAAMNKHLPAAPSSNMDTFESGFGHPILGLPKHKSTIQWIGGTNPHSGRRPVGVDAPAVALSGSRVGHTNQHVQ